MSSPLNRTRLRDDLSATNTLWTHTSNANPPVISSQNFPGLFNGKTEVMVDTVTPGFTSKVNRGQIFNNPMEYSSSFWEYALCSLKQVQTLPVPSPNATTELYQGQLGAHWDRYVTTDPNYLPLKDLSLIDEKPLILRAAIGARNRINPIAVQSLVSLAEAHKTFALIASSVNTLRSLRRNVVKGNLPAAIRCFGSKRYKGSPPGTWIKKSIEDRWLEFRYGWTPLVYEVQGAIKALSSQRGFKPRGTTRFKVTSKKATLTNSFRDASFYGKYNFEWLRQEQLDVRAYCLFTADLQHQSARDFGLTELPLAAWELVPFSFVVDWFVNIGDWLEALTPKLGVNILAEGYVVTSSRVTERELVSWVKQTVGGNSYDASGTFIGTTDRLTVVTKRRHPNLDIISSSFPPINVKINVKRVLDAIALFGKSR